MKFKLPLLLAGGLLTPLVLLAQTVVTSGYSSGVTVVFDPAGISSSGTVVISGTANITFASSSHVTLAAGFKVATGALFRTTTGGDSDGDGLPDSWEIAHGLNPGNPADASNTTSAGLTYLLEYRLGTEPSTSKQIDTSNTLQLKVNSPGNP